VMKPGRERSQGKGMRRSVAIALGVCALAVSGCAGSVRAARQPTGPANAPPSHPAAQQLISVPNLVGTVLRDATCTVIAAHLRWSLTGLDHGSARPLSGCGSQGVASSLDDIRVTGQRPAAGTPVSRDTVVVLKTICTTVHPCA